MGGAAFLRFLMSDVFWNSDVFYLPVVGSVILLCFSKAVFRRSFFGYPF